MRIYSSMMHHIETKQGYGNERECCICKIRNEPGCLASRRSDGVVKNLLCEECKMKNKLIITFKNNGKLSFIFHRLALFLTMVLTSYSLLDSDISKWGVIPMIILIGLFIVDIDSVLSESQDKNEKN